MTLWDHIACTWYGVHARWIGLNHLLRGHDLRWREHPELWIGVTGDIACKGCPDTSDGESDLCIWIRQPPGLGWAAGKLCGWLGHPGWTYGRYTNDNPVLEHMHCTRCLTLHD